MNGQVFLLLFSFFFLRISGEIPSEIYHGHHEFSVDLVKAMGKGHQKNVVYSSAALESILILTALGAKGSASTEIRKALQLPESDGRIKSAFTEVHNTIANAKIVEISRANKIFLGENIEAEHTFVKTAQEVFQTEVQNVNFKDVENATSTINKWVQDQMNDRIKNLIKRDHLNPDTQMALINTLHFQGNWKHPFPKDKTEKRDFHLTKTDTIQVDTMSVIGEFLVHKNEQFKATMVALPFVGTQENPILCLALPDEIDGLEELEQNMKKLVHAQRHYNYTTEKLKLFVPKFKLDSSINMKPVLQDLGIKEIFGNPDFSGITKDPIKVDTINQKVEFEINENGAGGAPDATKNTEVGAEENVKEIHIDHPFYFGLQFDEIVIMAGRVVKPKL